MSYLEDRERRLKVAYLSSNVILNCFIQPTEETITRISLDIPPGTIILDRFYCQSQAAEAFVLWNSSWELVPLGDRLPELKVTHSYYKLKTHEPLGCYVPISWAKPIEGASFKEVFVKAQGTVGYDASPKAPEEPPKNPFEQTWRDRPPLI